MRLIGWNQFLSRQDQSEALPRSGRRQYGITAVVAQTSFHEKTSGGVEERSAVFSS